MLISQGMRFKRYLRHQAYANQSGTSDTAIGGLDKHVHTFCESSSTYIIMCNEKVIFSWRTIQELQK